MSEKNSEIDADSAAEFVAEMGINAVPIKELDDLFEQWKERGTDNMMNGKSVAQKAAGRERIKCAKEIREVIEQYE